jgi:hypothetical protein
VVVVNRSTAWIFLFMFKKGQRPGDGLYRPFSAGASTAAWPAFTHWSTSEARNFRVIWKSLFWAVDEWGLEG